MDLQSFRDQADDTDAIRNDLNEIRQMVRELLEAFTLYMKNGRIPATSAVFNRVIEEIGEVCLSVGMIIVLIMDEPP